MSTSNYPHLGEVHGSRCLIVDGKPFLIRGGEVSNSCSDNAAYMERYVWPYVQELGLNTLLVPVAWENIEAVEGKYDFSLPAQIIEQSRQRGMKLIFLWFGLWKNAQSSYVPLWMKQQQDVYFRSARYPRRGMHTPICSISPLCQPAIERDAMAFSALMTFLRGHDTERTVIAVQVENEVGLLGSDRDYCAAAEAAYRGPVPEDVAQAFDVQGTWKTAFGEEACAQFMTWCYARAVGRIAAAGAQAYDIPLYVNAWTVQYSGERPGSYPSGGPVVEYRKMWQLLAPDIQWFSPDIYLSDYAGECLKYSLPDQPLFVPEAPNTCKAASYALYTAGFRHSLGFSAYAVEQMRGEKYHGAATGIVQESFSAAPAVHSTQAASYYRAVNDLLEAQWEVLAGHRAQDVRSFLFRGEKREGIRLGGYDFKITFEDRRDAEPDGCGLLIALGCGEFLVTGCNCTIEVFPERGVLADAEFLFVDEMEVCSGHIVSRRRLNGDDQWLMFHDEPRMYRFQMHLRDAAVRI